MVVYVEFFHARQLVAGKGNVSVRDRLSITVVHARDAYDVALRWNAEDLLLTFVRGCSVEFERLRRNHMPLAVRSPKTLRFDVMKSTSRREAR